MNNPPNAQGQPSAWASFSATCVHAYHGYASWLVSITWRWFFIWAVALIIAVNIIDDIPPFSWTYTEILPEDVSTKKKAITPPRLPQPARHRGRTTRRQAGWHGQGVEGRCGHLD